jgi:hypothetical protein
MNLDKIAFGFSLVSLLAMAGCGNGVADDPLAGAWSNTSCFGSATKPVDIESCSSELTFSNDLEIQLKAEWISLAATAMHPGCTTTKVVTGQRWSAEHANDTFTVTGKGAATVARAYCVNTEDDLNATATTDIGIPDGDTTYTITGDTLTVQSGSLKGVYTR